AVPRPGQHHAPGGRGDRLGSVARGCVRAARSCLTPDAPLPSLWSEGGQMMADEAEGRWFWIFSGAAVLVAVIGIGVGLLQADEPDPAPTATTVRVLTAETPLYPSEERHVEGLFRQWESMPETTRREMCDLVAEEGPGDFAELANGI